MTNSGNATEQHRAECEARHWLAITRGDPQAVSDLMERIAKRRGQAAADRLLYQMRREWTRQRSG